MLPEEFLQLSGIQHFAFCRRQWALIHIECLWKENYRTIDGALFHETAHSCKRERRGGILMLRSLPVKSDRLGISGKCDVVEFHLDPCGVDLAGEEGKWLPTPVEYKRGAPKEHDADELQLCAQGMCLEEMLCCAVPYGFLYYGENRRRLRIEFGQQLKERVASDFAEMHSLFRRGHTPKVKPSKCCNACSLKELCLPALMRGRKVDDYLHLALEDG